MNYIEKYICDLKVEKHRVYSAMTGIVEEAGVIMGERISAKFVNKLLTFNDIPDLQYYLFDYSATGTGFWKMEDKAKIQTVLVFVCTKTNLTVQQKQALEKSMSILNEVKKKDTYKLYPDCSYKTPYWLKFIHELDLSCLTEDIWLDIDDMISVVKEFNYTHDLMDYIKNQ